MDVLLLFIFHVNLGYAVLSVICSLVMTCLERAELLALFCVVLSCIFCHIAIWCSGSGMVLDCINC